MRLPFQFCIKFLFEFNKNTTKDFPMTWSCGNLSVVLMKPHTSNVYLKPQDWQFFKTLLRRKGGLYWSVLFLVWRRSGRSQSTIVHCTVFLMHPTHHVATEIICSLQISKCGSANIPGARWVYASRWGGAASLNCVYLLWRVRRLKPERHTRSNPTHCAWLLHNAVDSHMNPISYQRI